MTTMILYLSGCSVILPVSGFRPVSPQLMLAMPKFFPPDILNEMLYWSTVESLQPTLSWQAFPGEHQKFLGAETLPFINSSNGQISDIKYDLRIWTVRNREPSEISYEIEGLATTQHTLERPLITNTEYYWSVRARFKVNGQPRISEWSLSQVPCPPNYGFECARGVSRERGVIPPENYYRFKTP